VIDLKLFLSRVLRLGRISDVMSNEIKHIRSTNNCNITQDILTAAKSIYNTKNSTPPHKPGTILEAAFVVPGRLWPQEDGQGKNAIELQASTVLLQNIDAGTRDFHDDAMKEPDMLKLKTRHKIVTTTETVTTYRCGFFKCCKSSNSTVNTHNENLPVTPEEKSRYKEEFLQRKALRCSLRKEKERKAKQRRRQRYNKEKYARVPEGMVIYRLDTFNRTLRLMSNHSSNIQKDKMVVEMIISGARPGVDKSRRVILLSGEGGEIVELVACEQRTAIAWMEALDMMLGNRRRGDFRKNSKLGAAISDSWSRQDLSENERDNIEEQYLNLVNYSNNLIRSGASSSTVIKSCSPESIYYTITKQRDDSEYDDEETIESVAKRRAVIKDSWDFYRMICSLLRDRRKYDEAFRRIQLDKVYPYLNSMMGLNDPGDDGHDSVYKVVLQSDLSKYGNMTKTQVCQEIVKNAEEAASSLVEICKALAGSLGIEEVGVGPVKEVSAVIRKAEKKYGGDILKVTDYCRALIVVKDIPTLLALLELARDSFGPLIRRVKLSSLKSDHKPLAGGYRDCKINLELKEHICEIQIHIWPMWVICGVDGFRHYRHCLEYSTDSFKNPYDSLVGLDRKTTAELIVLAEEAVSDMPLGNLEWYHEKNILDYFAEVGLFLHHESWLWAEITLRQLIKLRCESPDIGPDHTETLYLKRYLEKTLRSQKKKEEADEIIQMLNIIENRKNSEKYLLSKSLLGLIMSDPKEAIDFIMDPNKKDREEEERTRREVKTSRKAWRKVREERFKFLDLGNDSSVTMNSLPEAILK